MYNYTNIGKEQISQFWLLKQKNLMGMFLQALWSIFIVLIKLTLIKLNVTD